jgi:hypothetical protein
MPVRMGSCDRRHLTTTVIIGVTGLPGSKTVFHRRQT